MANNNTLSLDSYLSTNSSTTENNSLVVNNIGNMTYNNMKKLTRLNKDLPSYDRPYFIVLYGPPGSGKSSSIPLIEDLGVPYDDYVNIILDDMITSVRKYRNVTQKLKANLANKKITEGQFWYGIDKIFNKTRTGRKGDGKSINAMRTEALVEALQTNKNIIYETTGGSSGGQVFLKNLLVNMIPDNYRVVFMYPNVSTEQLKQRVANRADKFLEEKTPYYRSQKPEKLGPMKGSAIKFFKKYIVETFFNGYEDSKGNKREIFKIIMYQNEEKFTTPEIIKPYDNQGF